MATHHPTIVASSLSADGPRVVITPSSPTTGPFGEFASFPAARRLDGTLLSQRPWIMRADVGRGVQATDLSRHAVPAFGGAAIRREREPARMVRRGK